MHHDNWSDGVFLTLLDQHFTPVLVTEGKLTQTVATMATVPPQVHRASWVTFRFTAPQRKKLSWMLGWNHGLPGHGLTLRNGKDVPLALADMVFLHIPHLSLCDALVKTHGCKGVLPGPVRVFMAPPLSQRYWLFSHMELQYAAIPPSGTNLRQVREFEKKGGVAALVTGPSAPHPLRLLAESPFPIEFHQLDQVAFEHLQVIYCPDSTPQAPPQGQVRKGNQGMGLKPVFWALPQTRRPAWGSRRRVAAPGPELRVDACLKVIKEWTCSEKRSQKYSHRKCGAATTNGFRDCRKRMDC